MVKQPLFGQDSSPHITSLLLSSIITLICWIIFCVLCFVIKFQPKTPQYKEVQIVLNQDYTPVKEEIPEEPEPVEGPEAAASEVFENVEVVEDQPVAAVETPEIPKPVENPVAEAKQEAPKQDATSAPIKTNTVPQNKTAKEYTKVTEPETYGTFLGDDIDFGQKKTSVSNADWEKMNFKENESSKPGDDNLKVQGNTSGYGGVQGFTDKELETGKKSSEQQNSSNNTSALAATLEQLKAIKTSYRKSTGNVDSIVTAETTKSEGYINMKMQDGSTRALLDPITPDIKLSEEAAKLIDNNKRIVTITITVVESGNVLLAEIIITPESNIPAPIREEICNQLSKWRFMESTSRSIATFEYTIEKH